MASVASYLEHKGFEPRCLDLCFARNVKAEILKTIRHFEPEAIGISVRNIDNSDSTSPVFYLTEIKETVAYCRAVSDAPIIVGGAAVSVAPELLLSYLDGDYAVAGDGEEAFVGILNSLKNGGRANQVAGVIHRNGNASIPGKPASWPKNLDDYPSPQLWRWVDYERYARYGVAMPVQSKRGCVFKCIYCTYPNVEGFNYRVRSTDAVVEEIHEIRKRSHFRQIEFVDSTFNVPQKYTKALCEEIIRSGLDVSLQASSFNPKSTSIELFDLMERAGVSSLVCTPESGSDEMLERIKKGFTTKEIVQTAQLSQKSKIPFLWVFLFGNPGETEETVTETLDFIERYIPQKDGVFLTIGVRIYPNTILERLVRNEGEIADDNDLLRPTFYISPRIRRETLYELVLKAVHTHPNYSTISDLQLPFLPWLVRTKTALRIKKPLWELAPHINRVMNALRIR
ncbi:radical SAM protein [candidate division KSB1 bacterium]|nr:radical SAM protein [candidate division KSB1 bacterium]NIT75302.1 radical SAM protein [candidate division KSB1 bacterium]NIX74982.1 radical SAM protein [candidate division KSB1 bacterium]